VIARPKGRILRGRTHAVVRILYAKPRKAKAKWRRPRPWRSSQESQMIRRYAFQWLTCRDRSRPSGRAWARDLGSSHTWLQKLVRQFQADPSKMWRLQAARGDPKFADLSRAKECSLEMKERGELRSSRRAKWRGSLNGIPAKLVERFFNLDRTAFVSAHKYQKNAALVGRFLREARTVHKPRCTSQCIRPDTPRCSRPKRLTLRDN
jgi:hypothetical protein